MKNDDFLKNITTQLDRMSERHPNKPMVMDNVLNTIQDQKTTRYGWWKMSGFALAAAVASIAILPEHIAPTPQETQVVSNAKLSPQMVEDLEMLLVMGEDKVPHGS